MPSFHRGYSIRVGGVRASQPDPVLFSPSLTASLACCASRWFTTIQILSSYRSSSHPLRREADRVERPLRFVLLVDKLPTKDTCIWRLCTNGLLQMHTPSGLSGETQTAVTPVHGGLAEINTRPQVAPKRCRRTLFRRAFCRGF